MEGNINIQTQAADLMLFHLMEGKYTLWFYQHRDKQSERDTQTIQPKNQTACLHVCMRTYQKNSENHTCTFMPNNTLFLEVLYI